MPPWHCLQWWQNHRSSQRESQIWSCPSSMGGSVVEPQSDEEKQRIKGGKDTMFLDNTVLSTCPTNILPATLKVSVGEVPIVNCISHEICTRNKTHGPSSQLGGLQDPAMLCSTCFNLQNDPLHYSQKVKDRHNAAEENHNGQSLRKETKLVTYIE